MRKSENISAAIPSTFKKVSYLLGLLFLLTGVAVLSAWVFEIDRLKVLSPGFISVKVNTAIGFILSGLIILLHRDPWPKKNKELLISFFALILFSLGFLTLHQHYYGSDFGIDELLFKDTTVSAGPLHLGRPTPLNALFFLMFGLSFFPFLRKIKSPPFTQFVNLVVATIAFVSFVTYIFSTKNADQTYNYLIDSFQSSFAFIFLSLAGFFLHPEEGLMKIIASNSIGGRLFRKNFSFCLIVFLVLGWFVFKGNLSGYYTSELGISIFIISSVIAFSILLYKTTIKLTARENLQRETESALVASEEQYRTLIDQASDAIFTANPSGRFLAVNKQTLALTGLTEEEILGKTYFDFLYEDGKKNPLPMDELAEGKTVVSEKTMKRKDGKTVDVEVTAKLLTNGNLIAFVKDITQRKKQRQLLIESEQRLVRAESMGNLGHGYLDFQNNNMHLSAGMYKILGVTPEEFSHTYEGLKGSIHIDDYEIMYQALENLFSKGEVEVEFRIVHPGGDTRNVLFKTELTVNEKGEMLSSFTTALDITDRKKAEQEIVEKGIQLQILNDNLPDSFTFQYMKDKTGGLKYLYLSNSIENLTGKSAEEIKNTPGYLLNQMPEEDRKRVLEAREQSYRDMTPMHLEVSCYDKYGQIRNMLIRSFPRNLGNGDVVWDGVYTDITELKKADAERQALRMLSEQIISTMLDGFILADGEGNIIDVNPAYCNMIGFRRDELLKLNIREIEHTLSPEQIKKRIQEMMDYKSIKFETRHIKKDGGLIDLEVSISIMGTESKKLVAAFVRNITEIKKNQQQIENYNNQLQQLTAHLQNIRDEERRRIGREIHDDLGQQLTAIKMDVAWISKKIPAEYTTVKEKLKNIVVLLDASNISVRRILSELKPSILDEYGLLDALEQQARQFTASTGVPLQVISNPKELKLKENVATCIFRVFQESLTNIAKHAEASKVTTTIDKGKEKVSVLINDNGKGFEASVLQGKNSFGIIGMNERVRALNGVFEVVSGVGKGTTVKLELPLGRV